MKLSPLRVVLGLFVLALVVASALLVAPAGETLPELSAYSSAPNGGRALWLWLEALGYQPVEIEDEPYAVPANTAAVLVLQPSVGFDGEEVGRLVEWVENGGQLVIAATNRESRRLLEAFGLSLEFAGERQEEAMVAQPLLGQPPLRRVRVDTWDALRSREGLAPWLVAGERVYAGSVPRGSGRVVALSATHPLSNAGLAAADDAAFVLNLLATLPPGARVAVDEYHHGFVRRGARSLWGLLLDTSWGWATLYVVGLAYLYLFLRGRRFGPPVVAGAAPRRTVGEYVASLAALYRRAGQRAYAADRLAEQLKHELASGLGLSARLPDAAFAAAVGERRQADPAPLARLLARLRDGAHLREGELLALVREADTLERQLLRRGR